MASTHGGNPEPSLLIRDGGGAALPGTGCLVDELPGALESAKAFARKTVSYPRGLLLSTMSDEEDEEDDEAAAAAASLDGAGGFRADLLCWNPVGTLSWTNSFV